MKREYRIGEEYADHGRPDFEEDQFMRWLRGPLATGIRNAGGVRTVSGDASDEIACIVLISNTGADPWAFDALWEDTINLRKGTVEYWGDAKADEARQLDDFRGNRLLSRINEKVAAGKRHTVPPILLFTKPRKGIVKFCGLCVIDHAEIRTFEHDGERVPNYLFHLRVLDLDAVRVEWIHERATNDPTLSPPDVWVQWVDDGTLQQWNQKDLPKTESTDVTPDNDGPPSDVGIVERRYERIDRSVSKQFRKGVWARYKGKCPLTGIEYAKLLEVAHVLPRSKYPELAEHPGNALLMNVLHHRAFDAGLFTFDETGIIRVDPAFKTDNEHLKKMFVNLDGETLAMPDEATIDEKFLQKRNDDIDWW